MTLLSLTCYLRTLLEKQKSPIYESAQKAFHALLINILIGTAVVDVSINYIPTLPRAEEYDCGLLDGNHTFCKEIRKGYEVSMPQNEAINLELIVSLATHFTQCQ